MTATKHKPKSRKGLLPPVVAAAPKEKQAKQDASPSSAANGAKKGVAASVTISKGPSSTAEKPSTAAKIDKYTGKKKGTLFSATPSPSKVSAAFHKHNPSAAHSSHKQQSGHAQIAPAKAGAVPSAKGANGNSKQKEKSVQGGPNVSTQPGLGKKRRHRRKGKGAPADTDAAAGATAAAITSTPPPSNKGATGKSNWDRLKAHALEQSEALPAKPHHTHSSEKRKRRREAAEHAQNAGVSSEWQAAASQGIVDGKLVPKSGDCSTTEVLALDCEMVGVGTNVGRRRDALARAALINDAGNVLLDVWVRPKEKVTDYRFHVTGIRWSDLKDGISPEEASRRMHELTANSILVGHALHNDIKVLSLQGTIPRHKIRDTALYPPLMGVREKTSKLYSRSLKNVAGEQLGISIQKGEHDPVQDARAALYVYHRHRQVWEMQVGTGLLHQPGMRTSAKLTKGFRKQKRMRVDKDATVKAGPQALAAQHIQEGVAAGGSDDEFAPPDAIAVARMRARMAGDAESEYHLADT